MRQQYLEDKETRATNRGTKDDTIPAFSESLFLRDEGLRGRYSGLPQDLLAQSARRLRILALLYVLLARFRCPQMAASPIGPAQQWRNN